MEEVSLKQYVLRSISVPIPEFIYVHEHVFL
jgi:hypothetical protein